MRTYSLPSVGLSASLAAPLPTSSSLRRLISARSSTGPPGMGWLKTGAGVPGVAAAVGLMAVGLMAAGVLVGRATLVGAAQLAKSNARRADLTPPAPLPLREGGSKTVSAITFTGSFTIRLRVPRQNYDVGGRPGGRLPSPTPARIRAGLRRRGQDPGGPTRACNGSGHDCADRALPQKPGRWAAIPRNSP